MYTYKFRLKIKGFTDPVQELEDSINETMHGFGFSENIVFPGKREPILTVSSKKILGEKEINRIIEASNKSTECESTKYIGCDVE